MLNYYAKFLWRTSKQHNNLEKDSTKSTLSHENAIETDKFISYKMREIRAALNSFLNIYRKINQNKASMNNEKNKNNNQHRMFKKNSYLFTVLH